MSQPAPSMQHMPMPCALDAKSKGERCGLVDLALAYLSDGMFDRHYKARFATAFRHLYFKSESHVRRQAAELLANKSATPKEVVALVCCDQAEIASIMLASSPLLDEAELTTQILQGNMLHRRAIAQRPDLSGALISQLLFFGEAPVARQLIPYADHLPDLSQRLRDLAMRDRSKTVSDRGQNEMADPMNKSDSNPELEKIAPQSDTMSDTEIDLFAVDTPKSLYIDAREPTAQLVNVWQALDGHQPSNHLSTEFHYPPSYPMPLTAAGSEESKPEMTGSESHGPAVSNPHVDAQDQDPLSELPEVAFEDLSDEELEARFASGDFETLMSEEEEKAPRRVSFRIGVDDEENAPIPSLEQFSYGRKNGSVLMQGQDDESLSRDVEEVSPSVAQSKPLAEEEKTSLAVTAETVEPETRAQEPQAKGGQITLTIRKRNKAPEATDQDSKSDDTPKASVTLSSATEDDWENALADLSKEFDPKAIQASPITKPVVQEAKAEPASEPVFEPKAEPQITIRTTKRTAPEPMTETAERETVADLPQNSPVAQPEAIAAKAAVSEAPSASSVEPAPLHGDIFEHMEQPEQASPVPADEKLIHEHAPFGFMPDMVSFEGLELVEAEPDLPSATELLLGQRATPEMELVEPVEVHFTDYSLSSAMEAPVPASEHNVMLQVTEQLARERQARRYVEEKAVLEVNPVTHSVLAENKPNQVAPSVAEETPTTALNDLPAFADHQVVDEAAFAALKQSEAQNVAASSHIQESEAESLPVSAPAINLSRPLSPSTFEGIQGGQEGIAAQFFAYDADSRFDLLQAMLANSLADQALLNQRQQRLDEETAQALISARFSNDRLSLVEMLHDLSGHRRIDLAELLQDKGGEALVVYLYHIGLDESRALSFVLHGPDAIAHDYSKISQLMTLFDQLYPAAATRIVGQLLGAPSKKSATHHPIHDDGSGSRVPRLRQGGDVRENETEQAAPSFGRRNGSHQ